MKPNDIDQSLAGIRDGLPRIWWAIYEGSKEAGFNEQQAFALLTAHILSQNPTGIRPDRPPTYPE